MANHEMVKEAITEFKNCHNADISACFSNVCKVLSLAGKQERNDGAEILYQWAGKNVSKHRLKFYYASCSRALYHFLNEEHEPALQLVIEAKELFEEQNDQVGIGCCLILMGCIYRTLGNRDLALKTLWEGSRKLKSGHCPHIQLAGSYHMGCIYFEMGSIEEAIHHFKDMEDPAEKSQDLIFINYALHGLGKVYLLQKKYPEAKQFFGKALSNAEDNRNALGVSASLTELAILHFQAEDFTGAEELNKQALVVHEQNGFIAGAITNYIHLAEIYNRLSKQDEALAMLYKGLQLAEQIKVKPKIYQIHFLLSEIYESKKQFEKSLFHHKLFHEVRDQAEVEDNEKKLKNVQLIFEAEQTQKENEIIKKQKAEIERKNIELQDTIDELTLAKVSKKARVITFVIAIALFIVEDTILHFALHLVPDDNYLISLIVKIGIIFSLKPINGAVEHYLLKKVVRNRKQAKEVFAPAINLDLPHS